MTDFSTVEKNLRDRGYKVCSFGSGKEAADYLAAELKGKSVGIGGSMTIKELELYDHLSEGSTVYWHWETGPETRADAASAQVYLTSVNGLAETGEIINIDGAGNRVASTLYGHEKVYYIVGKNKLAETYDDALWRARNIASPKNARKLGRETPCAVNADKCYDCKSPDRICRGLVVMWEPMMNMEAELILIDEELGF